ncbi:uncharacterized protein V1513DRAFT_432927 [Lipomyces chichibuensis]|uniref:uncharacterized protein n=1 Tax=Lipomyces chichibuensis TaxID=1546026 RepID=UPI0033438E82
MLSDPGWHAPYIGATEVSQQWTSFICMLQTAVFPFLETLKTVDKIYKGGKFKDELIPSLQYRLDLVIYNPLAGGLFSGKYNKSTGVPESRRFSAESQQGEIQLEIFQRCILEASDLVQPVAKKHSLTMPEIGAGFITGVSSLTQMENDLSSIEKGPLPEDVVKSLERAWKIDKSDVTTYWHGELVYKFHK